MILPTIVSRCITSTFEAEERVELVPQFLHFFKEPAHTQLGAFAKFFETAALSEQMTTLLLDALLLFWRDQYHEETKSLRLADHPAAVGCLSALTHAGRSKIILEKSFFEISMHRKGACS